eukprot:TRINITY_DN67563_c5_g2_i1.p1 TRINITY_DN67563_c5_g2~~TRINITY_DN67563_c5_g2_i1.p1  ORF type:complete len:161 (+),score=15.77 TRINITY_DN67563_c5_g2_i1:121-603(+)
MVEEDDDLADSIYEAPATITSAIHIQGQENARSYNKELSAVERNSIGKWRYKQVMQCCYVAPDGTYQASNDAVRPLKTPNGKVRMNLLDMGDGVYKVIGETTTDISQRWALWCQYQTNKQGALLTAHQGRQLLAKAISNERTPEDWDQYCPDPDDEACLM